MPRKTIPRIPLAPPPTRVSEKDAEQLGRIIRARMDAELALQDARAREHLERRAMQAKYRLEPGDTVKDDGSIVRAAVRAALEQLSH